MSTWSSSSSAAAIPPGDLVQRRAWRPASRWLRPTSCCSPATLDSETHRELRYSAAVGGAVPALEAVRALADDGHIVSLSGVLNGTCNYILDRIAAGCSWEQAVAEAQAKGFAEAGSAAPISPVPTPFASCDCWPAAPFPRSTAHYVSSTGIDAIDPDWVQSGSTRRRPGSAGRHAQLVRRPRSSRSQTHSWSMPRHPFAQIRNEENCLLINTGHAGSAARLDGPWRRPLADDGGGDGRSLRP